MNGGALAAVALIGLPILGVVYWVACMLWPFTACGRCGGSGRRGSPSRRNYGRCRRCKGSGERLRFGRRVLNRLGMAKDKMVG